MPSYKYKIADSDNKILVIDVELPTLGNSRAPSNPDSNWTTETSGLLAHEMCRCYATVLQAAAADATNDDTPPAPVSGDAPIPVLAIGYNHLYLCEMLEPYNYGMVLYLYHGFFSANESGVGQLFGGWAIQGGLKAGQITWVQI
jgi:hypothetical protein